MSSSNNRIITFIKQYKIRSIIITLCILFVILLIIILNETNTDTKELTTGKEPEVKEIINLPPKDIPRVYITTDSASTITNEYSTASFNVLHDQKKLIQDAPGRIKFRGNSTTEVDKKSYKIKFDSKQDVLGIGEFKDWVLIANAFDKTLLRNKLVLDTAKAMGLSYTSDSRFVDLWLNDSYVGNYLLMEPVETNRNRVDIDIENNDFLLELEVERVDVDATYIRTGGYGLRLLINEPEVPTDDQINYLTDLLNKFEVSIQSGDHNNYLEYLDLDSFVDFYILVEYFKNVDVSYSSTRFYVKNGILYAGPAWDFDLSSGNASSDFYSDYNNSNSSGDSYEGLWARNLVWYKDLLEDEYFMSKVKARYLELQPIIINLYINNEIGQNQIDRLVKENQKSFQNNYTLAGWDVSHVSFILERIPDATYEDNVEYLREWLKKRNEWLLQYWQIDNYREYNYLSEEKQNG